MSPEESWQSVVTDLADLGGWRWTHFRPARTGRGWRTPLSGSPGWLDLTLVHGPARRFVVAELKSATGKLTPDQRKWVLDLDDAGVEVYVWRPNDLPTVKAVLLNPFRKSGVDKTGGGA